MHDLSICDDAPLLFEGVICNHVTVSLSAQLLVDGTKTKRGGFEPKGNEIINQEAYMQSRNAAIAARKTSKLRAEADIGPGAEGEGMSGEDGK